MLVCFAVDDKIRKHHFKVTDIIHSYNIVLPDDYNYKTRRIQSYDTCSTYITHYFSFKENFLFKFKQMLISCMKLPRFPNFFRKKKLRVLFLGLDGVGKTTIINRLKTKDIVQSIPTIGSNVEEIEVNKSVKLTIWDVGGEKKLRHLWKYHYQVSIHLMSCLLCIKCIKMSKSLLTVDSVIIAKISNNKT